MPRLPLALAILLIPATGAAQERLELEAIPDLSIFEPSLPAGQRWKKRDRLANLTLSLAGGAGTSGDRSSPDAVGAAVIGFGYRSANALVQARSELSGAIAGDDGAESLEELRGRHRVLALFRLRDRSGPGATLELDARVRHAGESGFHMAPLRFGRTPVVAASIGLGGRLEPWSSGDSIFYVPVRYSAERISWRSGSPVRSAASDALTLGFGFGPEDRDGISGGIDFIRGTVRHTSIDRSPPTAAAAGTSTNTAAIREVTLSTGIDELIIYDRKALMSLTARYGWTWLETDVPGLEDNLFTMSTAINLRRSRRSERAGRVGVGVARIAGHTADGRVLTADWRLELSADQQTGPLGFGARGALSWVTPVDGAAAGDETFLRYGAQLEAFYELPANLELGVYHAASFEPRGATDPWRTPRTWSAEAGLLLRYRRGVERRSRPHGRPIEIIAE